MTVSADLLRDQRRAEAVPGGARDKRIGLLFNALPVGAGTILAVMIITPMFPRGEVSFLLDRNKVAMTQERVQVNNATYRGSDDQGRAFSLSAHSAVQHSARVPVVQMNGLVARMQMQSGQTEVTAKQGDYHMDKERVDVTGPVQFHSADGYNLSTSTVVVDLKGKQAFGSGGVTGTLKTGTFSAERMSVDLGERKVTLQGRARLHMTQGAGPRKP